MKIKLNRLATVCCVIVLSFTGCNKDNDNTGEPNTVTLLEGSFNNLTYDPVVKLTWQQPDGAQVTGLVYPGQVVIIAASDDPAKVTQLINSNNATVAAAVPNAGFFVAVTDFSNTGTFLKAMNDSPLIKLAFPNKPTGIMTNESGNSQGTLKSAAGDASSIVQTIDVVKSTGCNMTHMEAVARTAEASGVSVNTNDVTVDQIKQTSDLYEPFTETMRLVAYSHMNKTPLVINLSMGGDDSIPGERFTFYQCMAEALEKMIRNNPNVLDNVVVIVSLTNKHRDETSDLNTLVGMDPQSPIWDHLYYVGSQEGASGCESSGISRPGHGYAATGTTSYLAAPACDINVPGTDCYLSGNSGAAPQISGLVAKTWELLKEKGKSFTVSEITKELWNYQNANNGTLPSPLALAMIMAGEVPMVRYDGTWTGRFYYTATVPQEEGPPEIINTSFSITMTIKSKVALAGYPHILKITGVSCSDPTFGATMTVLPDTIVSMVFVPGQFNSLSTSGMAVSVKFPSGYSIITTNTGDGNFSVDATGTLISSTPLVENHAFSAGNAELDSNDPASGPGGYAYTWCKFKNWRLEKVL